jgi:small neutral amino acid transporter SnatA (MarC family)
MQTTKQMLLISLSSFFAGEYLFAVIKIALPKQKVNNKLLVKRFAIDIFFGVVKEKIPNELVLQYFPPGYLNS